MEGMERTDVPAHRCAASSGMARSVKRALIGVFLLGASSCLRAPQEALRVGLLVWPPYELAYVARETGALDGVPVRLVDYGTPAIVRRDFAAGHLDAIAVTLEYVLQMEAGKPGQHLIVLAIDVSDGGDALLARPGIETVADLRGRRVGIEDSALGRYVLHRALQSAEMSPEEVDLVYLDVPDHVRAYREGSVDAVVTYEPSRTEILSSGAALVFDSSEIPGEIVDVLVTRRDVAERRREALEALIAGWLRAGEALRREPQSVVSLMTRRSALSPQEMLRTLNGIRILDGAANRRLLGGPDPEIAATLARHAETMRVAGLLVRDIETARLIDASFLPPEGGDGG